MAISLKPTKLTPKQLEAVEAYVEGPKVPHEDMAKALGVDRKTLYRWRQLPEFGDAIVERARGMFRTKAAGWLRSLSNAADGGDVPAIKTALQTAGILVDAPAVHIVASLQWPFASTPALPSESDNGSPINGEVSGGRLRKALGQDGNGSGSSEQGSQ